MKKNKVPSTKCLGFIFLENQLGYLMSHSSPPFCFNLKKDLGAKLYQKLWRYQERYLLLRNRCQTIDKFHM